MFISKFLLKLIPKRWAVQLFSAVGMNSYFKSFQSIAIQDGVSKGLFSPGLNCYACPLAQFSCPIGTVQHFLTVGEPPLYPLGAIGLAGVATGRIICGWTCPFGFIQDLLHKIPFPLKLSLPKAASYLRYVFLAVTVFILPIWLHETWFCKLCPAGALEGGIPFAIFDPDIRSLIGTLFWFKMGILAVFIIGSIIFSRPFCRIMCPLGTMLGFFNPVSVVKIDFYEDRCAFCDVCADACPVELVPYREFNSDRCIRCFQCVKACPLGALEVKMNFKYENLPLQEGAAA